MALFKFREPPPQGTSPIHQGDDWLSRLAVALRGLIQAPALIEEGGTGQITRQKAINALTDVANATDSYVLTRDPVTKDAIFLAGGSGPQGPQGVQGSQGVQGTQGHQGAQGAAGAQGPQGTTGAQGVQGTQGTQGTQGAQGSQGAQGGGGTGSQGPQGAQGSSGTDGIDGAQGAQGSQGTQGTQGGSGTGFYVVATKLEGGPTASQVLIYHPFPVAVNLPVNATTSVCKVRNAATAQTDFDLQKNGVSIGTIRFAAAGTTATYVGVGATAFAAADDIRVIAPASPDATLANLGFSLYLTT